jgi:uncharacterized protein YjbI with pentapeptide repeats
MCNRDVVDKSVSDLLSGEYCIFHEPKSEWVDDGIIKNKYKVLAELFNTRLREYIDFVANSDDEKVYDFNQFEFVYLSLKEIEFSKSVYFNRAKFYSLVSFYKVKFYNNVYFDYCHFYKFISLAGATFYSDIFFEYSTFYNTCILKEGANIFYGRVDFDNVKFCEDMDFSNIIFNYSVSLNSTRFEKSVYFRYTRFKSNASFFGAFFNDEADFSNAIFEYKADFRESYIEYIYFHNAYINEFVIDTNVKDRVVDLDSDTTIVTARRELFAYCKRYFEDKKDFVTADRYYLREMDATLKSMCQETPYTNLSQILILSFSKIATGFGRSWIRGVFVYLFISFFIFSIAIDSSLYYSYDWHVHFMKFANPLNINVTDKYDDIYFFWLSQKLWSALMIYHIVVSLKRVTRRV